MGTPVGESSTLPAGCLPKSERCPVGIFRCSQRPDNVFCICTLLPIFLLMVYFLVLSVSPERLVCFWAQKSGLHKCFTLRSTCSTPHLPARTPPCIFSSITACLHSWIQNHQCHTFNITSLSCTGLFPTFSHVIQNAISPSACNCDGWNNRSLSNSGRNSEKAAKPCFDCSVFPVGTHYCYSTTALLWGWTATPSSQRDAGNGVFRCLVQWC